MTAADIDLLAVEITRDAEALLAVAAAPDLPAGMVVLPLDGRDDASGSSLGSGHDLALAHGCRPGAVAVRVDVAGILRTALTAAADRPGIALDVARHAAEQVAIHEAAHALVADLDAENSIAEAIVRVRAADALPSRFGADVHHPRWAAAVVALADRAIRLRPAGERDNLEWWARHDLGDTASTRRRWPRPSAKSPTRRAAGGCSWPMAPPPAASPPSACPSTSGRR